MDDEDGDKRKQIGKNTSRRETFISSVEMKINLSAQSAFGFPPSKIVNVLMLTQIFNYRGWFCYELALKKI